MPHQNTTSGRREFLQSAAVTGAAVFGGLTATSGTVSASHSYGDVSWPLTDSDYQFAESSSQRYRSISKLTIDHYIAWNSSGYFEHVFTATTAHEANRQTGTDAYGDPEYTTEGWITESELNVQTISDGWVLSDRENEYLECSPGVDGRSGGYEPNEFYEWVVTDVILGNTPGVGTLVDLFEGGNALIQTLTPDKDEGYTTQYRWDYDNETTGELRDGESYPFTSSQFFQPMEKVNYDPNSSSRPAEGKIQTTWTHKGGGGAPDKPVAGFEMEIPTPDQKFEDMSQSTKDKWGVKPAGDSRFPLTGTDEDDLIATDAPADITYLS